MRIFSGWPALLCLLLPLPAHALGTELVLGVHPDQPIRTLIAMHEPLATHLRLELGRPVRLVSAKNSLVFGQRLLKGDYELALAPAHQARLAQKDHGWHPLARPRDPVPVYLLARKTDTGSTPGDLKHKVLAVADRNMLLTLAGERWLEQQHQLGEGDYTTLVTGGDASAVDAVVTGRADMALATSTGLERVRDEQRRQLRVIKEILSIPQMVFVARHDITPQDRAALQRALLAYRSPARAQLVAMGTGDLAAMDPYLPQTRSRLQTSGSPRSPRL